MYPHLSYELPTGTKLAVFLNEAVSYDTNRHRGLVAELEIPGVLACKVGWEYTSRGGKLWPATGKKGPQSTDDELEKKILEMLLGKLDPRFRAWLRERFAELYPAILNGASPRSDDVADHGSLSDLPTGNATSQSVQQTVLALDEERRSGTDRRRERQVIDLDDERARRVAEPEADSSGAQSPNPTELEAGNEEQGTEAADG